MKGHWHNDDDHSTCIESIPNKSWDGIKTPISLRFLELLFEDTCDLVYVVNFALWSY